MQPMPSLFVSDFGPFPAVEDDLYTRALRELGANVPRPRAVVIMSGHWVSRDALKVGSASEPGIQYDYFGFPDPMYRLRYPCPGEPALARDVIDLLKRSGVAAAEDKTRALDHGAWVPLMRMYPDASIPVVALSVPAGPDSEKRAWEAGHILSPLREKGVLLVGSGALSHNLRLALSRTKDAPADSWALEFDAWIKEKLSRHPEDILTYRAEAPHAKIAAPTTEHFDPLFFTLGAVPGGGVTIVHESTRYGSGLMKILRID